MRKAFTALLALLLTMSVVSCKQQASADQKQAGETAEKVEKAEPAVPSLEEIVAKAKAEGANWSVDQWKDAFRNMAINLKPMLLAIQEMQKEIGDDPAKAVAALGKLQEKQKEFEGMENMMREFEKIAEASENGKKVADDEEWGNKMMEELGLPTDL